MSMVPRRRTRNTSVMTDPHVLFVNGDDESGVDDGAPAKGSSELYPLSHGDGEGG